MKVNEVLQKLLKLLVYLTTGFRVTEIRLCALFYNREKLFTNALLNKLEG